MSFPTLRSRFFNNRCPDDAPWSKELIRLRLSLFFYFGI